ncbi:MAG: SDR family oxidoreductase, partial [Myxococcota bacterium]
MSQKILIAGCGDVGNALGRRMIQSGHQVWGIRRTVSALSPGIEPWPVDLTDRGSLRAPPTEFDVMVYAASADRRDAESYRATYVDGLRHTIDSLRDAGSPLTRILFTSSTAVYGQSQGEWVDEESTTAPRRFNGEILLEAEDVVTALDGGVVLRLSGIYGPGRTRLLRKVWSGEATATDSWTNRIHVEDCGAALAHLIQLEKPASVYLGSDDAPVTTAEVVQWMSQQLGVDSPPVGNAETVNKRCRNARLVQSGFTFIYPTFREGYAPMVSEFLETV